MSNRIAEFYSITIIESQFAEYTSIVVEKHFGLSRNREKYEENNE